MPESTRVPTNIRAARRDVGSPSEDPRRGRGGAATRPGPHRVRRVSAVRRAGPSPRRGRGGAATRVSAAAAPRHVLRSRRRDARRVFLSRRSDAGVATRHALLPELVAEVDRVEDAAVAPRAVAAHLLLHELGAEAERVEAAERGRVLVHKQEREVRRVAPRRPDDGPAVRRAAPARGARIKTRVPRRRAGFPRRRRARPPHGRPATGPRRRRGTPVSDRPRRRGPRALTGFRAGRELGLKLLQPRFDDRGREHVRVGRF